LPDIAAGAAPIVIRPSRGRVTIGLRDLVEYRELLYFLVWRDVKVRYKQTVLGVAWVVLQPLLTMVVFSIFFGRLAGLPSDGAPYPVFVYTALLPWQLFSTALTGASGSLVASQQLIQKVYFPRLIMPLSIVLSGLVDFGVAFGILLGLMVWYRTPVTAAVLLLPPLLLLAIATALAVGLWLSVLNVRYRDVRHALPFLSQLWLFATPVAYPSSLVPAPWTLIYGLNPMVGVVEGFRWALLGTAARPGILIGVSAAVVLMLLVGGLRYFRRAEATFADVI
jgi:lipopolysaccharide transport system permease protein